MSPKLGEELVGVRRLGLGAPPPLLKIDPASAKDRESAGKADFKAAEWRALLKTDPPNTTLGGFAGRWTGKYAPDDKTAR